MRRVVVLVVIPVLLLLGDAAVRGLAESRLENEVEASLLLERAPRVELGGFPFVVRLIAGSLPEITLVARDVGRRALTFEELRARLVDVEFSASELLSGDLDDVRASSGRGSATLTETELNRALREEGVPVTVDLEGGRVRVGTGVEGSLTIENGRLVIESESPPQRFEVDLPRVARGLTYESVRIAGAKAVVSFRLRNATLVEVARAHAFR